MSNNEMILKDVMSALDSTAEQIEAEKSITWETINDIKQNVTMHLKERLNLGAEKYQKELPIFTIDDENRDNLLECEYEILDGLNYSSAARMKAAEFGDDKMKNAYRIQITRVIAHLCYAYYNLKVTQDIINDININKKDPKEDLNE